MNHKVDGVNCLNVCLLAACAVLAISKLSLADQAKPRTLTDADLAAGRKPAIGDTVILSDFARCFPHSAISLESVKGKWWLRPYRTANSEGKMLCVEQRDKKNPSTCIAPSLTYPANLEGVFDIWVGAYRPVFGGGIDIKLTRDKTYGTVDPWEEARRHWPPDNGQAGKLVEMFYKTADLTGQNIHLRQPKGTYQSGWWGLCNAHCAYVKLVRRAPADVQRDAVALRQSERKGVVIDRDGFSYCWLWGTESLDCILQQVEQYQYGNIEALNWCIGGTFIANFPHPMSRGIMNCSAEYGRLGDFRFDRVDHSFRDRGIDSLQVLVDRCHELGIKIYVSERTSDDNLSVALKSHPEWINTKGGVNYANPGLRAFLRDYLLYIATNYDIDGLTVDFTRNRNHFNPGEEKPKYMTSFLKDLRAGLDRISKSQGKRLVLNVSFTTGTWYDSRTAEAQGLDVQGWVNEDIVDCIMPEGKEVLKYIQMCNGKKTKCYGRYSSLQAFDGSGLQADIHDPTANEDKHDKPPMTQYGPSEIARGTLDWYAAGASGVFLFNQSDAWTTLRHLPYFNLLREDVARGQPFGMHEGDAVEWLR
jgi:hypothetical protein